MKKFLTFRFFYFLTLTVALLFCIPQIRWATDLTWGDRDYPLTSHHKQGDDVPTYSDFRQLYKDSIPETEPIDAQYHTSLDLVKFAYWACVAAWLTSLLFGSLYGKITGEPTRFSRRLFAIGLCGKSGFWIGFIFAFANGWMYAPVIFCALGLLMGIPGEMFYNWVHFGHLKKKS